MMADDTNPPAPPVSTSASTTARIADPTKLREVQKLPLGRALLACRFDPTGKYVIAGGMNFQATCLTMKDGKLEPFAQFEGHRSWIGAVEFHPQRPLVYCGDYGGAVSCWPLQADAKQPVWMQDAHQGWIRALAVSSDGQYLATCGNDQRVRLWTTEDARFVRDFEAHESHVYNVAFHPNGTELVSADLKGTLRHWEVATGRLVRTLECKQLFVQQRELRLGGVRCLKFSPDGKTLAVGGMSGIGSIGDGIGTPTVVLFNWETGKAEPDMLPKEAARTFTNGVAFLPDGQILGATGGLDRGYLLVWKPGEKQTVFQTKLPESAWGMDMHPDGLHLVMAHHDSHLRLYDMLPA